ncbi:MAG TPA: hypothetical protein GXX18_05935 [Bacillales bacterium]|nr:hypothetical protein [Bacillales bacterium]
MKIKNLYKQLKELDGMAFQHKFTEIMKKMHGSNFHNTQIYRGDKKVDGVLLEGNTAFAVHAPEVYKDADVLEKLKDDYEGFMEYREKNQWTGISSWIFVIKSKRKGVTANVLDFISEKNGVNGVSTGIMTLTDIKNQVNDWSPQEIPKKLKTEIRSKIIQIRQNAKYLIDDYIENADRLYHSVELEGNAEKRAMLFSNLAGLISDLEQFYYEHLGAFEEIKIAGKVNKIIGMSPIGITFIDLHEGYKKISEVDKKGNYVLLEVCEQLKEAL